MDIWTFILSIAAILVAFELLAGLLVFAIIWHYRNKIPGSVLAIVGMIFVIAGVFAAPTILGFIVLVAIGATMLDVGLGTKIFYPHIEKFLDRIPLVGAPAGKKAK